MPNEKRGAKTMTEENIKITDNQGKFEYSVYLESECKGVVTTSIKKLEALETKLDKRLIRLELKHEAMVLKGEVEECDDLREEYHWVEIDWHNVVKLLKKIKKTKEQK